MALHGSNYGPDKQLTDDKGPGNELTSYAGQVGVPLNTPHDSKLKLPPPPSLGLDWKDQKIDFTLSDQVSS